MMCLGKVKFLLLLRKKNLLKLKKGIKRVPSFSESHESISQIFGIFLKFEFVSLKSIYYRDSHTYK